MSGSAGWTLLKCQPAKILTGWFFVRQSVCYCSFYANKKQAPVKPQILLPIFTIWQCTQRGTFLVFHTKVVFTCIHKIPIVMPTELWCQSKSFGISSALYFAVSDGFHCLPTLLATLACLHFLGDGCRVRFWSGAGVVPAHSQPTSEVLPGSTFRFQPKTFNFSLHSRIFRRTLIPQLHDREKRGSTLGYTRLIEEWARVTLQGQYHKSLWSAWMLSTSSFLDYQFGADQGLVGLRRSNTRALVWLFSTKTSKMMDWVLDAS